MKWDDVIMNKTVIYLIRHCEQFKLDSIKNINEDDQINNEKIILTISGEKTAEKLSKTNEMKNIEVLFSSNYVRAISTAKYIAYENNISLNIDSNFNERKLGDIKILNELGQTKKNSYTTEQLLDGDLKVLNGESRNETYNRFKKSFDELLINNLGKRIAIVTHGAAIKFMLMKWCEFDLINKETKYKGKVLINDKLKTPEIFKLTFNNYDLIDIEKLNLV